MELACREAEKCVGICRQEYYKRMSNAQYFGTLEELLKTHKLAKSHAEEHLIKIIPLTDPNHVKWYEEELHSSINEAFEEVKKDFERRRRNDDEVKTGHISTDAWKCYHNEMKKHFNTNLFIIPAQLNKFHAQAKVIAMTKCEANALFDRFKRTDIGNNLDTQLETYVRRNEDGNDYHKLMTIELNNVATLDELVDVHVKAKVTTLDRLARNCPLQDTLVRKEYEWKLRKYIDESFEEIKYNLVAAAKLCIKGWEKNLSEKLLEILPITGTAQTMSLTKHQKQEAINKITSITAMQLKFIIPAATKEWLQSELTPKNISNVRTVYDQALKDVLSEAHKYVDAATWNELDRCVDEECRASCTSDLCTIVRQLQKFFSGMKSKFDYVNGVTTNDLGKCGREEIVKAACGDLPPGGNLKVGKVVEIGCSKLMDHFGEINLAIIKNRHNFIEKLIGEGLNYYDEEMKRLFEEDTYPPEQLTKMHQGISEKLIKAISQSIKSLAADEDKCDALRTALEKSFVGHLQQNNAKLKKIQGEANNILQASKSSYVAKIEVVMKENPDGLDPAELHRKHEKIAQEEVIFLERETQHTIVYNEPLDKHQKAFQVYVVEYWKYISEINNLNLKKGELREPFVAKKPMAETKMEGEHGRSCQEECAEPKMFSDEVPMTTNTGREHQLESDMAPPSKLGQELLQQCHELKEQLDGGTVFKIKSGVVREMFAKKIEGAIAVAKDPNSNMAQIQEQVEVLEKWSSKYRK